jgi:hypothetical protein
LLYVFIIIEKNKYFYLFLFFSPVIMLKATSHAKTKRKIHRGSLLTEVYLSFWIYTATAVHEAGALAPANAHGAVPGSLLTGMYFYFCLYTATAVHEVDAARLRMRMAQLLGACSQRCIFLFGFIRRQPYMKQVL